MTSKQWTNAEVKAIRKDRRSHSLKELEQKYSLRRPQLTYALYNYRFKDETISVEIEPSEIKPSKADPIFATLRPEFVKKVLRHQATYFNEQFRKIFKKIK
jgi:hypothetical protein